MAAADRQGAPLEQLDAALQRIGAWLREVDGPALGDGLIEFRERIDRSEALFVRGVGRFDKAGDYQADGALSMVAWLRARCRLSGGAAAERVTIAQQLAQLPKTEAAFARGELGYQHAAAIARTAGHIGTAAVRQEEGSLLRAAERMDAGQFTGLAKDFEHRVDAAGALAETNRAFQRRYLHVGQPVDGLVRLDGLLDSEGGETLQTALNALVLPGKDDDRTAGQRRADALIELCRRGPGGKHADGAGPRPQLVIHATMATLRGEPGAPAGRLESGATVPSETVQRHACDSTVSKLSGLSEFGQELSQAERKIPPATRRALAARDQHCVFNTCDRLPVWCDGHHVVWWTRGGATELKNLALLCRHHHRMVHEEGWTLQRGTDGRWLAKPPKVPAAARSA